MNQTQPLFWYALWTRSRHEKQVRDQLDAQGIEPLLPLIKRKVQWKDRKKEVDFPLFPGYCFARFSKQESTKVIKARGVVRVIGVAGKPEAIPDDEIESIRKLMNTNLSYDVYPYLQKGVRVRISRGPLEGLEGILSQKEKHHRVVISINLIQQSTAVEIDLRDIVPV